MANSNTKGFGLISVGTVGSTPATQGQGKYYIDAGDTDDLFQGCTVRMKDGYIVEASSTRTFATIGVLNGIFYNAATTLKPTWANWYNQPITPANSEDITAFVIDNPFQLFMGSTSAAVTQANVGRTVSFAAAVPTGSEISGQCTNTMDIGNINDTNNQWRIIRNAEDPENNDQTAQFCSMIFAQNLGQFLLNTATVGNDWTI
jgi:hypothetical protein